jgi:hypothetical protein
MAEETTEQKPSIGLPEMKDLAHKYQVPVSDGTLKEIVGEGDVAPEKATAFEEYLKTAAQGLYPSFAPQIAAGIPTAHLLDPYRQVGKQMLGENFDPDFLNSPLASAALNGSTDPKTGRSVPMTLDQWRNHIMKEPGFGWGYTNDAHQRVQMVLNNLKEGMAGR